MKPLNFFLAAFPLVLLASCAPSESPQSIEQQKMTLCTQLAQFNTAVATLRSMSPSSTVGDLRTARDQVKTTFDVVKTSARTVKDAKTEDLDRAYNDLDKAISDVPNTATLQQAMQSITPKVAAVEAAQTQMRAGLSCP